ncbi:MAG: ABC transporter substrate-binding protein, partial [Actinobacteria bacterium]
MRKTSFSAVVLAVIALAALPGALARPATRAADPGITSTTILLGGTAPLTGPAAAYASVARGAKAYFDSVNAKGGVAGRKIQYKYLDDGYDPAQTVQDTRQLVEQDKAFAIFNTLGTEVNLSIRDYLNAHKIPQLFAA